MGKYFGTDGFRGEANVTLTARHAFLIGRFLGWYYGQKKGGQAEIAIGKDTRRSSYMLEDALSCGLTASGANAYLLHVTTTPSVSYVVRTEGFDCGIMISASHNPYYDNGIKIIRANGQKIEPEVEEMIERFIDEGVPEVPFAHRDKIGRTVDYTAGRNRYIGYLISLPTRSFKGMKVGLDCANGSASSVAKSVFDALGAETTVIGNKPDGTNINLGCGSTHIDALKALVTEKGLDIGFAYDGDADRCIAVDDKGQEVNGDLIMYVCGRHMQERGLLTDDTVVTTVMSNLGLYKAFEKAGIRTEQTPVGDKYVAEEMRRGGFKLGGEQSGHIIFSKYAATGDGLLTSLMVMQAVLDSKMPLSYLTSEVKIYPQLLKNVRVKDKAEAQGNEAVQAAVRKAGESLGSDGRILVRESGTEPLIRVMVEAETDDICRRLCEDVAAVIVSEGLTAE